MPTFEIQPQKHETFSAVGDAAAVIAAVAATAQAVATVTPALRGSGSAASSGADQPGKHKR
ncbi:hypothetical protein GCM10023350_35980 [Nocardioides endophyticus]|uniref:Uncharacterized protein n=1 Tax=Nocardioides endophyticus TaxID=1353775 RepID=A0ABP8Z7C1_9ACTN